MAHFKPCQLFSPGGRGEGGDGGGEGEGRETTQQKHKNYRYFFKLIGNRSTLNKNDMSGYILR